MAEGYNSYLRRPVSDYLVELGRVKGKSKMDIDRELFHKAFGCTTSDAPVKLAGGQMQRLAV